MSSIHASHISLVLAAKNMAGHGELARSYGAYARSHAIIVMEASVLCDSSIIPWMMINLSFRILGCITIMCLYSCCG